jgi:hypothetical protein
MANFLMLHVANKDPHLPHLRHLLHQHPEADDGHEDQANGDGDGATAAAGDGDDAASKDRSFACDWCDILCMMN